VNSDEIRRQLRDSAAEQREALPRWDEALKRSFDPDAPVSGEAKAAAVGLNTSRRQLFRLGGLTLAAGAVLAACSGEEDDAVQVPVGSIPPGESTTTTAPASQELDITLVLTASSVEALAIAAYDAALEADAFEDSVLVSTAELFRDQHQEHLGLLSGVARQLGATPYEEPNPYLQVEVVDPALADLAAVEGIERQTEAVNLAIALESAAEDTYVFASGSLSDATLRQGIMSIGGVEARHVAVLLGVQREPQVPFPLARTLGAVPPESYITEDGPVTTPKTTTTTTAEGS
jgi:hypothetical protein